MAAAMKSGLNQRRLLRGVAALGLVATFAALPLAQILTSGIGSPDGLMTVENWAVLRFTLLQAFLSTLLSMVLALPLACSIHVLGAFPGRKWVLALMMLPLSLPAVIAALALLSLFGRHGILAVLLQSIGFTGALDIYGLQGVLLGHIFFNLPLAARLFVSVLDTIPQNHLKLAEALRMQTWSRLRLLCWPAVRQVLPSVAGLIFMLCLSSFSIVLILGGGPSSTTIEVAIYQALAYDLNLARAASLTLIQTMLVLLTLGALRLSGRPLAGGGAFSVNARQYSGLRLAESLCAFIIVAMSCVFVAFPFIVILAEGLTADHARILSSGTFLHALRNSVLFASLSAAVAVLLALAFSASSHAASQPLRRFRLIFQLAPNLVLALPPIVLAAGWFLLVSRYVSPYRAAPIMVISVNALMALPFAAAALEPAFRNAALSNDRLCESLRIAGYARMRRIDLPSLKHALATAFFFAMALSLGDLGVIALFGSGIELQTLPSLLFAKMGAYQSDDAAGIALYLMILSAALAARANLYGTDVQNG